MTISKGERTELRSVTRQQFKVLRAEVRQRETELNAQVEEEIAGRFAAEDQTWHALQHGVHEAVLEANRRINDALVEHGYETRGPTERLWLTKPRMAQPQEKRHELRHLAQSRIREQVMKALLQLDRQEADLLRQLSVGALESAEAHTFLDAIPTVGELVPSARLAELEATLTEPDTDREVGDDGYPD